MINSQKDKKIARPLRIKFPGAIYHIFSRGHRKENIFLSNHDREKFLKILIECIEKYSIHLYCYVLMKNHYHLFQKTPNPNLSEAMHHLNSSYSNWFKKKHKLDGSIFQGRFKSILVDTECYALTLSAYIHLNPVRAGFAIKPENYMWSSYHYYAGLEPIPNWINSSLISSIVNGNPPEYKQFVENWSQANNAGKKINMFGEDSILGDDKFKEQIRETIKNHALKTNQKDTLNSKALTCLTRVQIEDIFKETFQIEADLFHNKTENDLKKHILMYSLKKYSALSLQEISDIFDLKYVTTFQKIRRLLIRAEMDLSLKESLNKFEHNLKNKIYG